MGRISRYLLVLILAGIALSRVLAENLDSRVEIEWDLTQANWVLRGGETKDLMLAESRGGSRTVRGRKGSSKDQMQV